MAPSNAQPVTLSDLDFTPYLTDAGTIPPDWEGKVGIYAIFDAQQALQFVGYSRNVSLSLKQHLIRCPDRCHWVKVESVERPSRTLLEERRSAWIDENGTTPLGNGAEEQRWTQPIDAKLQMTDDEKTAIATAIDDLTRVKCLKQLARRVETEVLTALAQRGVTEPIRFDPKLKEQGLLNLKP